MTISLILLVSAHIFLVLTSAIFFYGLLLKLLARKRAAKEELLFYAVIGFVTGALSWFSGVVSLGSYYKGLLGSATDQSVTALIPLFIQARSILFPILALAALVILVILWLKGDMVNKDKNVKSLLITLTIIANISAAALLFLGILAP